MNAKKFESTYNGLTSVAKKVFDATPISEPWSISNIVTELARNGSHQEHRVVMGAMRDLCGRKLAYEVSAGMFRRVKVEGRPTKPSEIKVAEQRTKTADVVSIKPPATKKGPMELLAELATKARQFAEELDNAALEIDQEFQNSEAKSEKLKQLQTLLKNIAE